MSDNTLPTSNDILCQMTLTHSTPSKPVTTPPLTDDTLHTRRLYKRRGIVHLCWAGMHFAPGDNTGATNTFVDPSLEVNFKALGKVAGVETVEVFQPQPEGEVHEFWFPVVIPRVARKSKSD